MTFVENAHPYNTSRAIPQRPTFATHGILRSTLEAQITCESRAVKTKTNSLDHTCTWIYPGAPFRLLPVPVVARDRKLGVVFDNEVRMPGAVICRQLGPQRGRSSVRGLSPADLLENVCRGLAPEETDATFFFFTHRHTSRNQFSSSSHCMRFDATGIPPNRCRILCLNTMASTTARSGAGSGRESPFGIPDNIRNL